jgi:hypothetical protein
MAERDDARGRSADMNTNTMDMPDRNTPASRMAATPRASVALTVATVVVLCRRGVVPLRLIAAVGAASLIGAGFALNLALLVGDPAWRHTVTTASRPQDDLHFSGRPSAAPAAAVRRAADGQFSR